MKLIMLSGLVLSGGFWTATPVFAQALGNQLNTNPAPLSTPINQNLPLQTGSDPLVNQAYTNQNPYINPKRNPGTSGALPSPTTFSPGVDSNFNPGVGSSTH